MRTGVSCRLATVLVNVATPLIKCYMDTGNLHQKGGECEQ